MSTTEPQPRYPEYPPRREGTILDRIPGYRGYADKEARRDADGALRRQLAAEYKTQADRLTRVSQMLLAARKLTELAPVDTAARHLNHFTDRLRTATYGYAGLWENVKVDERALDQLYQFDLGLADGANVVRTHMDGIERAASAGEPLRESLAALESTTADLMARFDARANLFQTGQPANNPALFRVLLAPPVEVRNPLPPLQMGDAVSVDGRDWIVSGRTDVHGAIPWTDYVLRDGDTERWLTVSGTPQQLALVERVDFWTRVPPVSPLQFAGVSYTLRDSLEGNGTITGPGGTTEGEVKAYNFTGEDGAWLTLRDWHGERQAFVGRVLLADELQAYPKQGRK